MTDNHVNTDETKDTNPVSNETENKDTTSCCTSPVIKKTRKQPAPQSSDIEDHDSQDNQTTTQAMPGNVKNFSPDELMKLPLDEQMWYLIDDVIPRENKPTEVVIYDMGINAAGNGPVIELFPKSMEIFDEIVNAPNHAMQKYPAMVPYFPIMSNLESTYIKRDINPYWVAEPIGIPTGIMVTIHVSVMKGAKLFLHREPAPGRLPFRLCYGDDSHKHDFVGICYLSMEM